MNVRQLIDALLSTGLTPDSEVCIYAFGIRKIPYHISSVEEDAHNTGIIVIKHDFGVLKESEVGHK